MQKLTCNQIRQMWLDFWKSKDHLITPSKSLIPHNDNSLLWINSGVATLKDYFSGKTNPPCNRLANCQKAIRTNDIENVGKTSRHHTFFEMLGNFSIGDYFKKEAISWSYELLIKIYKFDLNKLYFTVYEKDDDAYNYWLELGIDKSHIVKGNKDRNFWDVGNGPCGPCTEIYYDRGEKYDPQKKGIELFVNDIENDRYVEIWNIVFSQFNNDGHNNFTELLRKNIDTGAGLERLICVIQDKPTNFDTDMFLPIIQILENFSEYKYDPDAYFSNDTKQKNINYAFRIIVDHFKACCFAIADGAIPSNKDRGYIIRKLIRRAIVYANKLGMSSNFLDSLVNKIIDKMKDFYPYLLEEKNNILSCLETEKTNFEKTLKNGFQLLNEICKNNKSILGQQAFKLMDTYGFPIELTVELANEKNINVDIKDFEQRLQAHQKISKKTNDVKAMSSQNPELLKFNLPSLFSYEDLELKSKIIAIFNKDFNPISKTTKNEPCWLVLEKTCLYSTSGGQCADKGWLIIKNKQYDLLDCINGPNLQNFHLIIPDEEFSINQDVVSKVNKDFRKIIKAHHSCEHLLQHCLQTTIDHNIKQEGSNKTFEKLDFDFNFHRKLTNEELAKIEQKVNEWINDDLKVTTQLLTLDEAKKMNAQAHFRNVYAKIKTKLRVVSIDNVSCEVCGGTHVSSLKEIEQFRIKKLISKGSGSWRIEAIATNKLINDEISNFNNANKDTIDKFKNQIANYKNLSNYNHVASILNSFNIATNWQEHLNNQVLIEQAKIEVLNLEREWNKLQSANAIDKALKYAYDNINQNQKICLLKFNDLNNRDFSSISINLINKYKNVMFVLLNITVQKITYLIVKHESNNNYSANEVITMINKEVNGKGGGRPTFSQGSCQYNESYLSKITNLVSKLNNY